MTRQEIKEEMKNTEGDPHLKARVRQIQREVASRRMMTDVPTATVVVTNCFFANPFVYGADIRYRRGYGFYAENADVTVVDCVFTNHRDTTFGYYNWGAAIHVSGGNLS